MKKMKKNNKGFTLVELIVVIAILGVLAAVLVPQYLGYIEKSRAATDVTNETNLLSAVETAVASGDYSIGSATVTIRMNHTNTSITAPADLTTTEIDKALTDIIPNYANIKLTSTAHTTYTISITSAGVVTAADA